MEIFLPSEVKKLPLRSNNFQSHRDSIPDAKGDSLPIRRNKSCPDRPDKRERPDKFSIIKSDPKRLLQDTHGLFLDWAASFMLTWIPMEGEKPNGIPLQHG
jgi:hypothetical protein